MVAAPTSIAANGHVGTRFSICVLFARWACHFGLSFEPASQRFFVALSRRLYSRAALGENGENVLTYFLSCFPSYCGRRFPVRV